MRFGRSPAYRKSSGDEIEPCGFIGTYIKILESAHVAFKMHVLDTIATLFKTIILATVLDAPT